MDTIISNKDFILGLVAIFVLGGILIWDLRKNKARLLKGVISEVAEELKDDIATPDGQLKITNAIKAVKMKLPFFIRIFVSEKRIINGLELVLNEIKKQSYNSACEGLESIAPGVSTLEKPLNSGESEHTGEIYLQGSTNLKGDDRVEVGFKKKF